MDSGYSGADAGLALGEPTPEDKRPRGWLAWLIGISIWIALIALVALVGWLLY